MLLAEHHDNRSDLARTLHKAVAQIAQWINGDRNISEDSAREIERRARKPPGWMDQPHKPNGSATEEAEPEYTDSWPFTTTNPHQLRRLEPEMLRLVEDHIKAVLKVAERRTEDQWRAVALKMAAHIDTKQGSDTFTQFCLSVDKKLAGERRPKAKTAPLTT